MKKVTDLKENEGILSRTEKEAKGICKLMHEAGLKWQDGTNYSEEDTEWYQFKENTVYIPGFGEFQHYNDIKTAVKIYKASDFLTPNYAVTREALKAIYDKYSELQNENVKSFIVGFIKRYFSIFDVSYDFNKSEVDDIYSDIENYHYNHVLRLLFPNYEKPKQKKEITVWVNLYDNNKTYHYSEHAAIEAADDKCRAIAVELTGTYEI